MALHLTIFVFLFLILLCLTSVTVKSAAPASAFSTPAGSLLPSQEVQGFVDLLRSWKKNLLRRQSSVSLPSSTTTSLPLSTTTLFHFQNTTEFAVDDESIFAGPSVDIDGFRSGAAAFQIWRVYRSILKCRFGELQNRFTSFASVQSSLSLLNETNVFRPQLTSADNNTKTNVFRPQLTSADNNTKISLGDVAITVGDVAITDPALSSIQRVDLRRQLTFGTIKNFVGLVSEIYDYLQKLVFGTLKNSVDGLQGFVASVSMKKASSPPSTVLSLSIHPSDTQESYRCYLLFCRLRFCRRWNVHKLPMLLTVLLPITVLQKVECAQTLFDELFHRIRWYSGEVSPFQIWRVAQLECA